MTLFRVLASGVAHCTESGCTDGGLIGEVLSWFILGVPIALFFGLIWLLSDPPWAKWNRDARRDKRLERMAADIGSRAELIAEQERDTRGFNQTQTS